MKFATSPVLELRLPTWRARLMLGVFVFCFIGLGVRAVWLQGMNKDFLQQKGESRYSRIIEISANRGKITDRNGEILAISTPVKSVWAIPEDAQPSSAQLTRLAALLDMPAQEIRKKLNATDRDFVYVKRQLPPETAEKVAEMQLPGFFQKREYRRYYPGGEAMAHMLGFTGVDETGQEGIELAFQQQLAGKAGSRRVIKDRRGQIVEDMESIKAAQEGQNVTLALDAKIQSIAFTQLKAAIDQHKAKAGGIVVMDAKTGEILALANLPTYNPNNRTRLSGAQLRNRAVTDSFEPGSTLKPFTIALALDTGKVQPDTMIQTSPGTLTIGTATIHDAHAEGALTVEQVIQKSSNVGAAKIALSMSAESMAGLFANAGFGTSPRSGFPGEVGGKVRPYKSWRPIEQATMSYGHGIAVSLLQLARSYSLFTRDGELLPLSLTRVEGPVIGKSVISAQTARQVRHMLEMAVSPGGTAPRAQIMGYRVGGKTGTAHKQENGGYAAKKYISSFVGFAPVSDPRLVIAVMIDEPSNGQHYGGQVAAPVFASVMAGALRRLEVPPDAPLKPIELPADGQEVQESI